jgi:hypothetical protein
MNIKKRFIVKRVAVERGRSAIASVLPPLPLFGARLDLPQDHLSPRVRRDRLLKAG